MDSVPARKKREEIPFPIGSPEHDAERKRRARENWNKGKERYRKPKTEELRATGDAPPLPKNLPISWNIPDDLHDLLGEILTLSENWNTWAMFHVRRQSDLSKITMQQYKSYYYKLPQKDIWDVARYIAAMPLAQRNQAAKAGLSYISQSLYESIYERNRKGLASLAFYRNELLKMLVFAELSKRTKAQSYEKHTSQEASPERLEATVMWNDWTNLAARFVKTMLTKSEPTKRDKQEALAAAVYSLIPPVRLDWNDVEVSKTKGGKAFKSLTGEKGKNILYLAPREAIIFWGEFKNSSSFGDDLPLKQEVPRPLLIVLHKLAPQEQTYIPFKLPNFSTWLTGVAETITGKPFTNRLMRSSYVRHYHDFNSKDGVDINKTKEMMKLMHQKNLEVHLAYNKIRGITEQMAE